MFQPHIIYFQIGKRAILQCLLDGKSRVIGMYMHLYHIIIRNDYNRISDRFQVFFKIHFHLNIKSSAQHDNKFRTVTEFNLRICLCFQAAGYFGGCRMLVYGNREVDFFAKIRIICAF